MGAGVGERRGVAVAVGGWSCAGATVKVGCATWANWVGADVGEGVADSDQDIRNRPSAARMETNTTT